MFLGGRQTDERTATVEDVGAFVAGLRAQLDNASHSYADGAIKPASSSA